MPADPYVEAYIEHGQPNMQVEQERINDRAREPHALSIRYQNTSPALYAPGTLLDAYPRMPIVSRERRKDGPNWLFNLDLEGISDDSPFIETDFAESTPEEGWDEVHRGIFTDAPDDTEFARGARLRAAVLTGVTGTAATDKLTKTAHGLVTGQLFAITFASGFAGLTTTHEYWAIRIDADNIKAATTKANALASTAINITSDGTAATITAFRVGYEYLWLVDRQKRAHRAATFFDLDLGYKGLRGDKPAKRRISTSGQAVSTKVTGMLILSGDNYVGYPPVDAGTDSSLTGTDLDLEYDIPGCSVTDTLITTTAPPTNLIGQFWSPTDPPTTGGFTIFGDAYTYHVPFGWKCTALQSEQLAGQQVWLVSVTWANQRSQTPNQPSA